MNVGQILETHLGWSCTELGEQIGQLINENQKNIEKTERLNHFLSLYMAPKYLMTILINYLILNLKIYVKI